MTIRLALGKEIKQPNYAILLKHSWFGRNDTSNILWTEPALGGMGAIL